MHAQTSTPATHDVAALHDKILLLLRTSTALYKVLQQAPCNTSGVCVIEPTPRQEHILLMGGSSGCLTHSLKAHGPAAHAREISVQE